MHIVHIVHRTTLHDVVYFFLRFHETVKNVIRLIYERVFHLI